MTPAELEALVAEFRQLEVARRQAEQIAEGTFSSFADQRLDSLRRSMVSREDMVSDEAVAHTLLFLRACFSQATAPGGYFWAEDARARGRTDWDASTLGIESDKAPTRSADPAKPLLTVIPGPVNELVVTPSTLKHLDFGTGTEVHTGLDAGTIQVTVKHSTPSDAMRLANLVRNLFRVHRKELRFRQWHEVSQFAMGGYSKGNPAYGAAASTNTSNVVIPITFSYIHQWTYRIANRPGTLAPLRAGIVAQEVDETTEDGATVTRVAIYGIGPE